MSLTQPLNVDRNARNEPAMSTWQAQFRKEAEAFMGNYDWSDIYLMWQRRIQEFAAPVTPLFLEIALFDSGRPRNDNLDLTWWPRVDIEAKRNECEEHFKRFPGTCGPAHETTYQGRKGELDTLNFLWAARHDTEQVAAVLISASLFTRFSGRGRWNPNGWPNANCVDPVAEIARNQWKSEPGFWHHANSQVLPFRSEDFDYGISDLRGLIRYLAEEHAALLHQFAPVALHFE